MRDINVPQLQLLQSTGNASSSNPLLKKRVKHSELHLNNETMQSKGHLNEYGLPQMHGEM